MVVHYQLARYMPCKYDYLVLDCILAHNHIDKNPLNFGNFGHISLAAVSKTDEKNE